MFKLIDQILKGYKALNDQRIVHRDLKPANILLHDGKIKISDLGFSKFFLAENASTIFF